MWLEKLWYRTIQIAAAIVGWGAAIIGAVLELIQVTTWLKTAVWKPYTIADALLDWSLPLPYTPHLLGVQKIIDKLLSWPATLGYLGICIGGLLIWFWATERLRKIGHDEWLAEQAAARAIRENENREAAREDAERSKADFDFTEEIKTLGNRRKE